MRLQQHFAFILLALCFAGCMSAKKDLAERTPAGKGTKVSPQLLFSPAPVFDSECQQKTGFKIDASMQVELGQRIKQFQDEWNKRAIQLISSSEMAAGKKFSRTEYSVALTLCKWTPMGDPAFIVSVRPYLGKERIDGTARLPFNMSTFVSMTHHELLHSLVENIINETFSQTSALLEKYKNEHFNVLVHLHLMAIQKSVYEKMQDKELIHATEQLYDHIGGDYARAWEIVRAEGVESFLAELRLYNSRYKDLRP